MKNFRVKPLVKIDDFETLSIGDTIEGRFIVPGGTVFWSTIFLGIKYKVDRLGRIRDRVINVSTWCQDTDELKRYLKDIGYKNNVHPAKQIGFFDDTGNYKEIYNHELKEDEENGITRYHLISDKPLPSLQVKDFINYADKKKTNWRVKSKRTL